MPGHASDGYSLVLQLDSDDPEFRRGVEIGMLWARLEYEPVVQATVHADTAEMVIRIAEARDVPFSAEQLDGDWLEVTIGALAPDPAG